MIGILKSNMWPVIQFLAVAAFVAFGVYTNSTEVPKIQAKVSDIDKRVTTIESQMPFVVAALSRIEQKIDNHNANRR